MFRQLEPLHSYGTGTGSGVASAWLCTTFKNRHGAQNISANTVRLQAALAGSLRSCTAPAAGYLKGCSRGFSK